MKLKTLLLAGATTLGLAGSALALDQAQIDAIASELAAQGFTKLEVKISPSGAKVEAHGPNGDLERTYDRDGNLVKEERGGGRGFGDGGSDDGSADNGSDDSGSDDSGSADNGSDDHGSDDNGSDDNGSDDNGSDDHGSDDHGSDDHGSDDDGHDDGNDDDKDDD